MFNLSDYSGEIRDYATRNNIPMEDAVDRFVKNLVTISDAYPGFGDALNFRKMGQEWNKMTSSQRNKQKSEMLSGNRTSRRMRME